jgi:hypothetical protein
MYPKFRQQRHAGGGDCDYQRTARRWSDRQHACQSSSTASELESFLFENQEDADRFPIQIKDAVGNDYGRPKDVAGETRMAFTSHADSAFDVCFENILTSRKTTLSKLQLELNEISIQTRQS